MYKFTLLVVLVAIAQLAAGQVSLIIYSTADGNMGESSMVDTTATVSQVMNMDSSSYAMPMPTTMSSMSPTIVATATTSASATASAAPTPTATSTPASAWAAWGAWYGDTCSNPCGNGTWNEARLRCKVNDPKNCEIQARANVTCVGNCTTSGPTSTPATAWSQWSAWVADACSNPCGNGTYTRIRRRCKANDGNHCENDQDMNVACVGTACGNGTASGGALHAASYSLPLVYALIFISITQFFF